MPSRVGPDFFDELVLGEAFVDADGCFVDAEHADALATLSQRSDVPFPGAIRPDRFDRGTVMSRDRRLTRTLALELFDLAGRRRGRLRYTSVRLRRVLGPLGPALGNRTLRSGCNPGCKVSAT
jgi:hypothetical protein